MNKKCYICFVLAVMLLAILPMTAFAEAPAESILIEAGKAAKNEDGSYRFSKLDLSGAGIVGVQVSFADQMRPGDSLVAPKELPEGITANENLTSHAMLSFDIDPAVADTAAVEAFLQGLSFTKGEQTKELLVYFNVTAEKLYQQVFYFAANDKYYEIFFCPCCAIPIRHMDQETLVATDDTFPVVRGYSQNIGKLAQNVSYRGMQGKPARIPDEATDNFLWEVLNFGATIGAIHTEDGWYWMDEKGEASADKVEYARIAETEPRYGEFLHYSINLQKEDDGRHGLRSAAGNHSCTGYLIEYDKGFLAQNNASAEAFATTVGMAGGASTVWMGWAAIGVLALAGLCWAILIKVKQKKKPE